jgi:hypothetical protein
MRISNRPGQVAAHFRAEGAGKRIGKLPTEFAGEK